MPIYTYRFNGHWTTTSDELTGYIERFEVTEAEALAIEGGAMPDEVLGVIDPYTPPPIEEEPVVEEPIPEE